MSLAAALLRDGKYYAADGAFRLAAEIRPGHALATLGRALALFAAGEHYRAGLQLRGALAVSAALAAIRVDVSAIVGDAAFERSLADLEARLARQGDGAEPMLVLAAAFARHNRGDVDRARPWAETLRRLAGDDEVLAAYAAALLGPHGPGD